MSDGFADGHRLARVLAIAVPLGLFLLWWALRGGPGEIIEESEVAAVVIERKDRTCLIRSAQNEEARLLCPELMEAGMNVQLTRSLYDSGEIRYALSRQAQELGLE